MSDAQKRAMAELVTGKPFGGSAPRAASRDEEPLREPSGAEEPVDPVRVERRESRSHDRLAIPVGPEGAGLTAEQVPQLKLKWAFAMPGAASMAWSQPTVVGGKVFIGGDNGFVYALDARSGCVHWSFEAQGQVRSPIAIGDVKGTAGVRYGAFFGDYRGNIYAVERGDRQADLGEARRPARGREDHGFAGRSILQAAACSCPSHPGRKYPAPNLTYKCCTFQGSVVALDAATGKQIWKT